MLTSTTMKNHNLHKLMHIAYLLLICLSDIPINPLDKSTACCSANPVIEMAPININCDDTLQPAEDDEINKAIDPRLRIDFSADDVAYLIDRPTDFQHHDGPFDKSFRTFAKGKPTRYCSQ